MKLLWQLLIFSATLLFKLSVSDASSPTCETLRSGTTTILQKCDHLSILWLKGNPIERARNHASLLGKEFTQDNLKLFVELSVRGLDKSSLQYKLTDWALDALVWYAYSQAPESFNDEVKAMAEVSGISTQSFKRAIFLPDLSAFSWAAMNKKADLDAQGCTSAVFRGDDGSFLYGRNLDFPGSPAYDKNPLLVIHIPEDNSKELKHVSIGTQGLQFSGITGFNEAGITFAVHQNYTSIQTVKGVPMPFVGELVLRSARTLEEALEIIRKNRPGPLWTFVLTHQPSGKALAVEVSQEHFEVRPMTESIFAQTNFMLAVDSKKWGLIDAGNELNAKFRYQFALDQMAQWKNPTAKNMVELLSFQRNPDSFSPVSDVMKFLSIQSVVFEQTQSGNKFYVTIDSAPSPAGRWMGFDQKQFWKFQEFKPSDLKLIDFIQTSPARRALQMRWAETYSYDILRLYDQAIRGLEELPQSPDSMLALAALKLKTNKISEALEISQKGKKLQKTETPRLVSQGLDWIQIAGLWKQGQFEKARLKAQEHTLENWVDRGVQAQIDKIKNGKNPDPGSLEPGFDFFGGYLQGLPTVPTD